MQDRDEFSASYDPRSWLPSTPPQASVLRSADSSLAVAASTFDLRNESVGGAVPATGGAAELAHARTAKLAAATLWAILLLAGAAAARLDRAETPRQADPTTAAKPAALLTIAAEQPSRLVEALIGAGISPQQANRISRQAGDALRPGDRQIRLTVDSRGETLMRLEATSADGSKLTLDRSPRH